MKEKALQSWNAFWKEEDGIGTLEMLLIIAVILVLAIAFRKWISEWVNNLFEKTNSNVQDTLNDNSINLP